MDLGYGKARLVPTGKVAPVTYVSYKISHQLVETTNDNGSFLSVAFNSIDAKSARTSAWVTMTCLSVTKSSA